MNLFIRMNKILIIGLIFMQSIVQPVINPDNVKPGDWFIPNVQTVQSE